jgi:hypothetical protein
MPDQFAIAWENFRSAVPSHISGQLTAENSDNQDPPHGVTYMEVRPVRQGIQNFATTDGWSQVPGLRHTAQCRA